jgi:uncharacterized protein (DUF2384 family)
MEAAIEEPSQLSIQPFLRHRVDDVMTLAATVFGSREKALLRLRSRHHSLNNQCPISILATESGRHTIESMLWQIDEGIYT